MLMKKILFLVSIVLIVLVSKKISHYTFNEIQHPELSLSMRQERLVKEILQHIQAGDADALENHLTTEFHQRIINEPSYFQRLFDLLSADTKLGDPQLISVSERILDKRDHSLDVIYKIVRPDDFLFMQITFQKRKKKNLIDNIQINKVLKTKDV